MIDPASSQNSQSEAGGRKRLILHIGSGKCGSSAIQAFLGLNRKQLLDDGVLVPDTRLGLDGPRQGHQLRYFESGVSSPDFADEVRAKLLALNDSMIENDWASVVVSGENLINPKGFPALFAGIDEIFDVTIVVYIRRQDDLMVSSWQQWHLKRFGSFDEYHAASRRSINWNDRLNPWRDLFGRDNMVVRVFDPSALVDGNVVNDFCDAIGIDVDRYEEVERTNRTLDERFNAVANRYREQLFTSVHDHRFYDFLADVLGDRAFKDYSGSSVLSFAQRRMIMQDYAEVNEQLRADYFPNVDVDEGVFPRPSKRDVHEMVEPPLDETTQALYVATFKMYESMKEMQDQITELQDDLAEAKSTSGPVARHGTPPPPPPPPPDRRKRTAPVGSAVLGI